MENKGVMEELMDDMGELVCCGEPKVIESKTYEENGTQCTEELLELIDQEGRASTIRVKYVAGKPLQEVTFSESGHGSNVWCSYQVASRAIGFDYVYGFTTTRYAKDVSRTFYNVDSYPVPGAYDQVFVYKFLKYIRNSSDQSSPTRTYQWERELRGSGTTS